MVFVNSSQAIGILLGNVTTYTTGDMFLTLFSVLLILIVLAMVFGIKLEYTAIVIFPLLLAYMAHYGEFIAIGFIMMIYLVTILTKTWLFR